MKEIKNDPYLFAEISTKMDQCHKTVTDMTRLLRSDTYGLGNHSIEFSGSIFELESRRQVRELNISRSKDGFVETGPFLIDSIILSLVTYISLTSILELFTATTGSRFWLFEFKYPKRNFKF